MKFSMLYDIELMSLEEADYMQQRWEFNSRAKKQISTLEQRKRLFIQ